MILNAYAVLDGFLSLLRLLTGTLVVGLAIMVWRGKRRWFTPEGLQDYEDRSYLVFLLALLLLTLNIVAWPLFYLLLQSYVPQWPGVMCIYGVTQVGAGSRGPSRFLPRLLELLQVTKPALVFLSGAWFVLYLVNRRTPTAPLLGRVLGVVVGLGLLAVADAAAETAYLAIPKKEEFLSGGCCTMAFDGDGRASRFLPQALLGEKYRSPLWAGYYVLNAAMIAGLAAALRPAPFGPTLRRLPALLAAALLSLPVAALFLVEIAAPALLHLPDHHCPYDLLPALPESAVGIGLFFLGVFAVGWACVAGWLADRPETRPRLPRTVRTLLALALFGYLGSVVLLSLELLLT
jgi:hypothetical protein